MQFVSTIIGFVAFLLHQFWLCKFWLYHFWLYDLALPVLNSLLMHGI